MPPARSNCLNRIRGFLFCGLGLSMAISSGFAIFVSAGDLIEVESPVNDKSSEEEATPAVRSLRITSNRGETRRTALAANGDVSWKHHLSTKDSTGRRWGHRLANGLLAPLRC